MDARPRPSAADHGSAEMNPIPQRLERADGRRSAPAATRRRITLRNWKPAAGQNVRNSSRASPILPTNWPLPRRHRHGSRRVPLRTLRRGAVTRRRIRCPPNRSATFALCVRLAAAAWASSTRPCNCRWAGVSPSKCCRSRGRWTVSNWSASRMRRRRRLICITRTLCLCTRSAASAAFTITRCNSSRARTSPN